MAFHRPQDADLVGLGGLKCLLCRVHDGMSGTQAAADSDPLRERLAERDIDLIAPHKRGRRKPPLQDGRKLRRYRRRSAGRTPQAR